MITMNEEPDSSSWQPALLRVVVSAGVTNRYSLQPENFVVGSRHNNRKIMLMDFACASGASAEFPRWDRGWFSKSGLSLTLLIFSAQQLTDFTYASRARQRDFEPTRKDDLESWTYCVSTVATVPPASYRSACSTYLPYSTDLATTVP